MNPNIGFAGISYRWFIGQVPPNANQIGAKWADIWGDRVKVRIPSIHSQNNIVSDADLPWAIVAKPTSQGNYASGTSGIVGGEWVIGFFLDETDQIPVITHVLCTNTTKYELRNSSNGSTNFKTVYRYSYGEPAVTQMVGGFSPTSSAAGPQGTLTLDPSLFEKSKSLETQRVWTNSITGETTTDISNVILNSDGGYSRTNYSNFFK
jgi:hypothetical protein